MALKTFVVACVSSNRNSFGLRGVILLANDGECWEVGSSDLNCPAKGDRVRVDTGCFAANGWEIPRRLEDAPPSIGAEVWLRKKKVA